MGLVADVQWFRSQIELENKNPKGFKRGGRGRDGCSPDARVDIRVVSDEGYLVAWSACLQVLVLSELGVGVGCGGWNNGWA